jgi:hypothetical protein
MPGETIKIVLDVINKSVPSLYPGYDWDYIINYHVKCGYYDYNQIIKWLK